VSNEFLEPPFRLTGREVKALRSVGWKPPTPRESQNFYRDWEKGAEDRLLMAQHAMRTLIVVYGVQPDQKLRIEVGLEKG